MSLQPLFTPLRMGDLEVLVERGRRALRVHLKDVDTGLPELARAINEALQ
jgi:transaldolase/glucose-6-phosphate isomerase